jgi:hypothetical protein
MLPGHQWGIKKDSTDLVAGITTPWEPAVRYANANLYPAMAAS